MSHIKPWLKVFAIILYRSTIRTSLVIASHFIDPNCAISHGSFLASHRKSFQLNCFSESLTQLNAIGDLYHQQSENNWMCWLACVDGITMCKFWFFLQKKFLKLHTVFTALPSRQKLARCVRFVVRENVLWIASNCWAVFAVQMQ